MFPNLRSKNNFVAGSLDQGHLKTSRKVELHNNDTLFSNYHHVKHSLRLFVKYICILPDLVVFGVSGHDVP